MKKRLEFWDWDRDSDIDKETLASSKFITACLLVGVTACLAGAILSFFL